MSGRDTIEQPPDAGGTGDATAGQGRMKEPERVVAGPGPGRGPFGGGMVGQNSHTFWPSAKRLAARLAPERGKALTVVLLGVLSVSLSVVGPRILGHATNLIFNGLFGRQLPAGSSKAEAIAALHARGDDRVAAMLAHMDVVPGRGVDFTAVGNVLL